MSLQVKLEACLHALGIDPEAVDWHHEPPLGLRPYEEATGLWTPDANDPKHIVPLAREAHKARFAADNREVKKTARIVKKYNSRGYDFLTPSLLEIADDALHGVDWVDVAESVTRTLYKDMKRKIPSRPFPKRKHDK